MHLTYYDIADAIAEQQGVLAAVTFFFEELLSTDATTREKLDEIDVMRSTGFLTCAPYLTHAVEMKLIADLHCDTRKLLRDRQIREADIQRHFYANLDQYIAGAYAVDVPIHDSYRPDGFVMVEAVLCPVEVKRTRFTKSSLSQLLGYMRHFGCIGGVAVAQELCAELPPNVRWVQITEQAVFDNATQAA